MAGASRNSILMARPPRRCAASGSRSGAASPGPNPVRPPARLPEPRPRDKREQLPPLLAQIGRTPPQAPCLFSWRSAAEAAADRVAAALNRQVPKPRSLGAGLFEVAGRRDLLSVDGDDDIALLHADLSRGGVVPNRGDDYAFPRALERQLLPHCGRQVHHQRAVERRLAMDVSASRGGISGAVASFNGRSTVRPLRRTVSLAAPPSGLTPRRNPTLSASSTF